MPGSVLSFPLALFHLILFFFFFWLFGFLAFWLFRAIPMAYGEVPRLGVQLEL